MAIFDQFRFDMRYIWNYLINLKIQEFSIYDKLMTILWTENYRIDKVMVTLAYLFLHYFVNLSTEKWYAGQVDQWYV